MIRRLIALWTEPDAFRSDPRGYALNQLGHVALGAGAALVAPWWAVLAIYVAAVELPQWLWFGGDADDGAEDSAFVLAGALLLPGALVLAGLMLAAGVLVRRRARREFD